MSINSQLTILDRAITDLRSLVVFLSDEVIILSQNNLDNRTVCDTLIAIAELLADTLDARRSLRNRLAIQTPSTVRKRRA
jgi:hypothetical protein